MSVSSYKSFSCISDLVRAALTALDQRECADSDDPGIALAHANLEEAVRRMPAALSMVAIDLSNDEIRELDTFRTMDITEESDPNLKPGRQSFAVRFPRVVLDQIAGENGQGGAR